MIPKSLKVWFVIHFVVDMLFAFPLLVAPVEFMGLFGFEIVDPFMPRLVAAALFGIGGVSFVAKDKGIDSFVTMLNLKIIWSVTAILGMVWSIIQGSPSSGYLFVGTFAAFFVVWTYYRIGLSKERS